MRSIRNHLFLILMLTTGAVWLSAIVWNYFGTRAEVERVLDARLVEAARMVSSLMTSQEIDSTRTAQVPAVGSIPHSSYDRQLSCQIWSLEGTLVGRSLAAPAAPLTSSGEGFSESVVDGERWRVYAVENRELGVRVLVGDNLRVRDRLAADALRGLALPALLLLPVLAGLTWLGVREGLSPLSSMAKALETRPASDLSALPHAGSPEEIKPVIRSLNGLFARVQAARQRERDFTAFAAHELRTPISGLKTQAQVALASDNPDIRDNALRQIVVGVDRTARLMRQLTDMTNAETGDVGDDEQRENVGALVRQVAEDTSRHYRNAARIEIDPLLDRVWLHVDRTLLTLALRNLVENAILYSPRDTVVRCGTGPEDGPLLLTVEDEGSGIPETELPRVQERFYRGHGTTTAGSGLGLSIAAQAMRRLGGELVLRNRAAGGLRAELRLDASLRGAGEA